VEDETYFMNEAAFEAPGRSADWTAHALGLGRGPDRAFLDVHRTQVEAGADVAALAAANVKKARVELPGYRLIAERRHETVEGIPVVDVVATWSGSAGEVFTRQAHLVVGRTWLVFAASADDEGQARCDAAIERAITTFRARR